MYSLTHVLASFTWDPGFRGVLVVSVGVIGLMGSVFMILSTNTGARLGFLIAFTGLLGWMFLMSIVWSMYGIGYKGPAPAWKVKELSFNTSVAGTSIARAVPNADKLPTPKSFLDRDATLKKQFEAQPKPPNLGDLVSADPKLNSQIPTGKTWKLLSTSDAQTGDAVATANTFLGPDNANKCAKSTDCVLLNAFTTGGKPKRTDDSSIGRALYKLKGILTFWSHPPHYAVVQIRPAIPQVTPDGQAPPIPVPDTTQPVMSVIMERDLGAKREPSIVLAIFMGVLFAVCCNMLHRRDKLATRLRTGA